MPTELTSRRSSRAKKAKASATAVPKAPVSQREFAALRLFLAQDNGFRLALARFDRPATRDGLMARLTEDLAKKQVLLSSLDLADDRGSLLLRVQEHLAAQSTPVGWRRALSVVNLETRLTYSNVPVNAGGTEGRDLTFLEEANLHRDAFTSACPYPLLLWLTELAEAALAKTAPDLWHWRNARFDFGREGSFLNDFRAHPAERAAWFERIAAAPHRLGDKSGEVGDLINLGIAKYEMGDVRGSIDHNQVALTLAREIGDQRGEGNALGNLGIAYANLGESRKAIEFYEQSLVIHREIGDRRGEGNALGNLGTAYAELGEPRNAIEFYEQQLRIVHEIGDRRGEGNALGNLGIAYANLGESLKAIEFYEQQLRIVREIGDRRGEGNALGNLGNAYYFLGEPRKAIAFHEQALVIDREIGYRHGEGNDLWNSALALEELGERAQAIERAEAALRIHEAIEDPNAAKIRTQLVEWRSK